MSGDPNGLRTLAKYSKLPVERIRYLSDADEAAVRAIKRGVLIQVAFWSSPAIEAFRDLTSVISKIDDSDNIELVVVDTDGARSLFAVSEFLGAIQGAGETVWVRNGEIIATSGLGRPTMSCLMSNTKMLLEAT
jgi:hypothetical protein